MNAVKIVGLTLIAAVVGACSKEEKEVHVYYHYDGDGKRVESSAPQYQQPPVAIQSAPTQSGYERDHSREDELERRLSRERDARIAAETQASIQRQQNQNLQHQAESSGISGTTAALGAAAIGAGAYYAGKKVAENRAANTSPPAKVEPPKSSQSYQTPVQPPVKYNAPPVSTPMKTYVPAASQQVTKVAPKASNFSLKK